MMRHGQSFEDAEVAEAYLHRPDYADGVYRKLIEISPRHVNLLDLGCGTGKIARRLSAHFNSAIAIDPSEHMLRVAATQQPSDVRNITWVRGLAEDVAFEGGPFDLVVAAASIHWMNHAVVFPKLLSAVGTDHVFAAVDGDGALDPPWQPAWDEFLEYWIYELKGEAYEPERPDSAFAVRMNRYREWLDVSGEMTAASEPISQRVEDFIACQHSRDTFAPSKLGARLREFDQHLARILEPYAIDGMLIYAVESKLVWGSIRVYPRKSPSADHRLS